MPHAQSLRRGPPDHVLVVGLSVTGDVLVGTDGPYVHDNYVAHAARILADEAPKVTLSRAAIAGLEPWGLACFFSIILDKHRPEAVVLEIATFRARDPKTRPGHRASVGAILHACASRSLPVAFLDLPRKDVDASADWVVDIHRDIAEADGLAYLRVPLRPEVLFDLVHPEVEGMDYYGRALADVVAALREKPTVPRRRPRQAASQAQFLPWPSNEPKRIHSRYGVEVGVVAVSAPEAIETDLPAGMSAIGLACLTHPRAGRIVVTNGALRTQQVLPVYSNSSYYERLVVRKFRANGPARLRFQQDPAIPDIMPAKGGKDLGPRVGYIAGLLVEPTTAATTTSGGTGP